MVATPRHATPRHATLRHALALGVTALSLLGCDPEPVGPSDQATRLAASQASFVYSGGNALNGEHVFLESPPNGPWRFGIEERERGFVGTTSTQSVATDLDGHLTALVDDFVAGNLPNQPIEVVAWPWDLPELSMTQAVPRAFTEAVLDPSLTPADLDLVESAVELSRAQLIDDIQNEVITHLPSATSVTWQGHLQQTMVLQTDLADLKAIVDMNLVAAVSWAGIEMENDSHECTPAVPPGLTPAPREDVSCARPYYDYDVTGGQRYDGSDNDLVIAVLERSHQPDAQNQPNRFTGAPEFGHPAFYDAASGGTVDYFAFDPTVSRLGPMARCMSDGGTLDCYHIDPRDGTLSYVSGHATQVTAMAAGSIDWYDPASGPPPVPWDATNEDLNAGTEAPAPAGGPDLRGAYGGTARGARVAPMLASGNIGAGMAFDRLVDRAEGSVDYTGYSTQGTRTIRIQNDPALALTMSMAHCSNNDKSRSDWYTCYLDRCHGRHTLDRQADQLVEGGVSFFKSAGNQGKMYYGHPMAPPVSSYNMDCNTGVPAAAIGAFTVGGFSGVSIGSSDQDEHADDDGVPPAGAPLYRHECSAFAFGAHMERTLVSGVAPYRYRRVARSLGDGGGWDPHHGWWDNPGPATGGTGGTSLSTPFVAGLSMNYRDLLHARLDNTPASALPASHRFVDLPGFQYVNLMAMALEPETRPGSDDRYELGAGLVRLRTFTKAHDVLTNPSGPISTPPDLEAHESWKSGMVCIANGEEVRLELHGNVPIDARIDRAKLAIWTMDRDQEVNPLFTDRVDGRLELAHPTNPSGLPWSSVATIDTAAFTADDNKYVVADEGAALASTLANRRVRLALSGTFVADHRASFPWHTVAPYTGTQDPYCGGLGRSVFYTVILEEA